jgi:hypothetical protein
VWRRKEERKMEPAQPTPTEPQTPIRTNHHNKHTRRFKEGRKEEKVQERRRSDGCPSSKGASFIV